jgi:hypothetical protein
VDLVSYALVSLGNTKTFLGINNSDKDELLSMLINMATDYLETKCGRRFKETSYTSEEYDGTGNKELVLKQYPIISFTSLQRNRSADNSDDWETIDTEDYWYDTNTAVVTKTSVFNKGTKNYRATYSAGYSSIPYDLQYACMVLVSEAVNRRSAAGVKSETLGDHTVTFESIFQTNPVLKDIVNNYSNISL